MASRNRRGRRYWAAVALGATAAGGAARAEDDAVRTILFGSLDAGRSTFVTAGAKLAVDRADRDGIVALASLGGGYRFERGPVGMALNAPTITRTTWIASAVAGYQIVRGWGAVAAFVGPEASVQALSGGSAAGALPVRYGLRLHGEAWIRPTDATLATGTLILGSTRTSAYARASWGYRLWGAYLGPEATLYADATGYRKWGVGLHATDFALGRVGLRVSIGCEGETGRRGLGAYGALAAWTPW